MSHGGNAQFVQPAALADGVPAAEPLQLRHDLDELIDQRLGHLARGVVVGLLQDGHGCFHEADQLRPLQERSRKPVGRFHEQFRDRHVEHLLPFEDDAQRQIRGLVFLPANFRHLNVQTPRERAPRYALQTAHRAEPVQDAMICRQTNFPGGISAHGTIDNAHDPFPTWP